MNRKDVPSQAAGGWVAAHDGLAHLAYFYDDERDYLSYLSAFIRAGLRRAQPVFVMVPDRKIALLREHLGDGSPFVQYGDMTQVGRNPGRLIPAVREFIDAHPGRRIRHVCEAFWPGRSSPELCEAIRHEALTNLAFAAAPATILCPYDVTGLPPAVMSEAECTHPAIVRHGQIRAAEGYQGRGAIPPGCDQPLPPPPAGAEVIGYRSELGQVRRMVTGYAGGLGMPGDRVTDLVIAVGEVTANTLRHTDAPGTLHIWHTEYELICQVRDRGWITDPLVGRRRQPPEAPGQGLWVVNQVCDLVESRTARDGTTILLHMRRETG
jgi:anti-sigma regulatory factor (Ser/Thr protein kinase)